MKWNPIYALVKKIPRGHVMTYGQVAKFLRVRGGARTAGHAMAASPTGQGVPWHRVVGAGGKLLVREPHASLQRKLLESEGLSLAEKRILNFKDYLWSPGKARGRRDKPESEKVTVRRIHGFVLKGKLRGRRRFRRDPIVRPLD